MALNPIRTAPKNGELILLRDEAGGVFQLARWCCKNNEWIGEDETPVRVKLTGWIPLAGVSADHSSRHGQVSSARRKLHAGLFFLTGLAILLVPSLPTELVGRMPNGREQTNARAAEDAKPTGESFTNMRSAWRVFGRSSADISATVVSNVSERSSSPTLVSERKSVFDYIRELVSARRDGRDQINVAIQAQPIVGGAEAPSQNERQLDQAQLASLLREIDSLKALISTLMAGQADTMQAVRSTNTFTHDAKYAGDQTRQQFEMVVGGLASTRAELESLKTRLSAAIASHRASSRSAEALPPADLEAWHYHFLHSRQQQGRAAQ
jgi:hypothetical protein